MAEKIHQADITQSFKEMDLHQHISDSNPETSLSHNGSMTSPDNKPKRFLNDDTSILEAKLEEQGVFRRRKKSAKCPKAKYYCRLCDYHCDTLQVCFRHVKDKRHKDNNDIVLLNISLEKLPRPTAEHIHVMDRVIENLVHQAELKEESIRDRELIRQELEIKLQTHIPGMKVITVGSTRNGFALANSNLDLALDAPNGVKVPSLFRAAIQVVSKDPDYSEITKKLSNSYPSMQFVHSRTKTLVDVTIHSVIAHETAVLMSDYCKMDPRVRTLGIAFRAWAKLCQIDNEELGSFPAHCYPMMAIHFLQHSNPPVIPCRFNAPNSSDLDHCPTPDDSSEPWVSNNTQTVGELWLDLMRFYAVSYPYSTSVINIRLFAPIMRTTSGTTIFIEDPMQIKRNLTRCVRNKIIYKHIKDILKISFRYFTVPQLSYGIRYHHIQGASLFKTKMGDRLAKENESSIEDENDSKESEAEVETKEASFDWLSLNQWPKEDESYQPSKHELLVASSPLDRPLGVVSEWLARQLGKCDPADLRYSFNSQYLMEGVIVPIQCSKCFALGHVASTCHVYELPPLVRLPNLHPQYIQLLTHELDCIVGFSKPTENDIATRKQIVNELKESLVEILPEAVLHLFGSSANGFGFRQSDLDICMVFDKIANIAVSEQAEVIEEIALYLKKRMNAVANVIPITTARVPIVKFFHKKSKLEVDISLYNILAMRNTELLKMYADLDPRVRDLGYSIKCFAKECDIGDASRGSLSSYAYILLAIHYLQQCSPPVVPVLQELYDRSGEPPQALHDGWNSWFYSDRENLAKVWPGLHANKQSLGELWVGLFRYYTEVFDWETNVVTIRQFEPLSRLEKLWNTNRIAIEDPFVLSHNLGGGLGRKMSTYILTCFIKARETFGNWQQIGAMTPLAVRNIFHRSRLTDGAPPNDRGCRICGAIGHVVKECPRKLNKKNVRLQRRQQREEAATQAWTEKSPRSTNVKPVKEQELIDQGILHISVREQSTLLSDFVDDAHYQLLFLAIGYQFCSAKNLRPHDLPLDAVVYSFCCRCSEHEPLYVIKLRSPDCLEDIYTWSAKRIAAMVELVQNFMHTEQNCQSVPYDESLGDVSDAGSTVMVDLDQQTPKKPRKKKTAAVQILENVQRLVADKSTVVQEKSPPVKSKRSVTPEAPAQAAGVVPKRRGVVVVDDTKAVAPKKRRRRGRRGKKGSIPVTAAALSRLAQTKRSGVDLEFLQNGTLDPEIQKLIKLDKQMKKAKANEAKKQTKEAKKEQKKTVPTYSVNKVKSPSKRVQNVPKKTPTPSKQSTGTAQSKSKEQTPARPKRNRLVADLFRDLDS